MEYTEHNDVLEALSQAQTADSDQREAAREADAFLNKRDGQWEPDIIHKFNGKPRYTDDRTNPIVSQIASEISEADFTIKVEPANGDADKDIADTYEGLIRNIRNMSKFSEIQEHSARIAVESGVDGWEIVHDYASNDSFDQDLLIKPVYGWMDRVWFLDGYRRDGSDSSAAIVFDYLTKDEYKKQYPEKSPDSLKTESWSNPYYYRQDYVTIGRLYYKKYEKTTLYRMTNGAIYKGTEYLESVLDELLEMGIQVESDREIEDCKVYVRTMDNGGWLDDEAETVFSTIPLVPVYANYKVSEGKILYRGAVEKLMDMQRVHNYAVSRNVEEVALAPRRKFFMTKTMAQGHSKSLETLNTNMLPVQFYNPDPEAPQGPVELGGPQANPGLTALIQQTDQSIASSAGMFAANMGENPGLQSGVAIKKQIDKGDNSSAPYFQAIKAAVIRTGEILVKTIPKVYDSTRVVRILGEDGTVSTAQINQSVIDNETGQIITLNDLSIGQYDVVCDIAPQYKNRQEEAAEMFARIAAYDPALMELSRDIFFKNINAPGFTDASERARAQMLVNGLIPVEQMTEEERANYEQEQLQQEQQPMGDPAAMAMAEAEMVKAQAEMMNAQNKQAELQLNMQKLQLESAKVQLGRQSQVEKTQSETALNMAKIDQEQQKIDINQQQAQLDAMMKMQRQQIENQKIMADTLKAIREAMGADAIISQQTAQTFENISEDLNSASE